MFADSHELLFATESIPLLSLARSAESRTDAIIDTLVRA